MSITMSLIHSVGGLVCIRFDSFPLPHAIHIHRNHVEQVGIFAAHCGATSATVAALAKQFSSLLKSNQDVAENRRLDGFTTNTIKALITLLKLLLDATGQHTKHFRLVVLKTKDYSNKVNSLQATVPWPRFANAQYIVRAHLFIASRVVWLPQYKNSTSGV